MNRSKSNPDQRAAMQAASLDVAPHVHKGMNCLRCGATDCVIVPNVDPTFRNLQGVGLTQHAMLCPEQCAGPWLCFKCDEGANVPEHAKWCEVAHPGTRAEWEKKHDATTMRLAVLVASRGQFLPAFLMDALFPGFVHADPPSFAQFKQAAAGRAP